jgi:hypothetical protein
LPSSKGEKRRGRENYFLQNFPCRTGKNTLSVVKYVMIISSTGKKCRKGEKKFPFERSKT